MNKFYIPDITEVIQYSGGYLLVIQADFHKKEVLCKPFHSLEEADNHVHEFSLKQFPEWHLNYCWKCNE